MAEVLKVFSGTVGVTLRAKINSHCCSGHWGAPNLTQVLPPHSGKVFTMSTMSLNRGPSSLNMASLEMSLFDVEG